jgi:hypothetical protein
MESSRWAYPIYRLQAHKTAHFWPKHPLHLTFTFRDYDTMICNPISGSYKCKSGVESAVSVWGASGERLLVLLVFRCLGRLVSWSWLLAWIASLPELDTF